MITVEDKDNVLIELVSCEETQLELELDTLSNKLGLSEDKLDSIFNYFERLGLCEIDRCIGGWLYIGVNVEAYDISRFGGFAGQEELFKKNIEKLDFELRKLDRDTFEKIAGITDIIGGLSSFLALLR